MKMRYPNEDLLVVVEQVIKGEPGIWTARICRRVNGAKEDKAAVQYCGRCIDYANTRKRARAQKYSQLALPGMEGPERPTLPGMEAPHQLHDPCTTIPFRKLRYLLEVLVTVTDLVYAVRLSVIPDLCQPRGWDLATRFYPAE